MKANITITLKPGLLDAQGKTIKSALESLGFKGVREVRVGKYLEIELNHARAASAKHEVERMCKKLLANPVVEQYRIEIAQGSRL
ncbi:MAG: phosphoribosylformylglycinamidine synthase subunit PurS [Candidatus Omnitrophica bacterium]|nr:phosphoribosylformylglycinamidine synthase subunit PurS [Candidatus Omnitrophota bacterium]MBI3020379.1 phosphoribosylformylglycinamidine synthase subunit PurS [Candidatus Omnitrophota bacterium]MBI3084066.1 phosphoribosylformylglycinamidine synthase subunit PurS [Candidatus Omnitrophota bacterium]